MLVSDMMFDEIFVYVCLCLIGSGLVFMNRKILHHRSRQSRIEDIPRNICLKIPRTTCCVIHMMIYALQIKQKSITGVFCKILEQLLLRNILGVTVLKRKQRRVCALNFVVWGFDFFQCIYFLSHETIFFVYKFSHGEAFQFLFLFQFLSNVIGFYKLKKELSSAIFTIKILAAETFRLGRYLPLVINHECATMPSVNNATKPT